MKDKVEINSSNYYYLVQMAKRVSEFTSLESSVANLTIERIAEENDLKPINII